MAAKDKRLAACLVHLSPVAGLFFPFGALIAPLLFYLLYKDRDSFVRSHSAEAVNFQVTVIAGQLAAVVVFTVVAVWKFYFLLEWLFGCFKGADCAWPGLGEIGGWALIALLVMLASVIVFTVLLVWNLVEIIMASQRGWKGKRARYTFILRPIQVRWPEEKAADLERLES